jgi:hypothetical protein
VTWLPPAIAVEIVLAAVLVIVLTIAGSSRAEPARILR